MKRKKAPPANKKKEVMPSIASLFLFRLREGVLLLTLSASVFLLLSLLSYHHTDPGWSHVVSAAAIHNLGGRVGAWVADFFLFMAGYLAYVFPVLLCYAAGLFYLHRHRALDKKRFRYSFLLMNSVGFLLIMLAGSGLASLFLNMGDIQLPSTAGGILGLTVRQYLLASFNPVGSALLLATFLLVGVTLFSGLSWLFLLESLGAGTLRGLIWLRHQSFGFNGRSPIRLSSVKARVSVCFEALRSCIRQYLPDRTVRAQKTDQEVESNEGVMIHQHRVSEELTSIQQKESTGKPTKEKKSSGIPRFKKGDILPKLSLLDKSLTNAKTEVNTQLLRQKSTELEDRLVDFGVKVKVVSVYPGPVVTRYELSLAPGTKVSKITSLVKDLARSLSVTSVRVVEVIPGKSVIGVELPNEHREVVGLQEVLASKQYQNARSPLTLALGKDIAGHPVIVDLVKMPHLLVAGTTGSGKSVSLNAMLLSLLYKSSPEQLRLIMIDPKMLELAVYDGIPHLLTPVVTDMKNAAIALRWCVMEMERRYRLMASLGVRNIAGYNLKVVEARKRGTPLLDPLIQTGGVAELEILPQIVILADEFADMMVVVGKKVETLIARLAQKARAAGVHLIFATQRPSVDVITGLIKANIPTRMAFQVSSKVDSRTILDQQGAEQLLGNGDMLYLAPGTGIPVRVHGAYVGDDEVHRVVAYLKAQGEPEYLDEILDDTTSVDPSGYTQAAGGGAGDAEQDEYYDEAVDFVAKTRRVSISSIQRRFKVGYNRAASIVETMEAVGVVSKMEGNGMREVLVPPVDEKA